MKMKMPQLRGIKLHRLTSRDLALCAFIMFVCSPFINRCFAYVGSFVGLNHLSNMFTIIVIYLPVLWLMLMSPKYLKWDFWVFLLAVVAFFIVTYLIHPEYEYWYTRDPYGVWDYVLRPDNGIYIILFIRLVDDPKDLMKGLKIAGFVMCAFYAYELMEALNVGYWVQTDSRGEIIYLSYNLTFGYDVSLFALYYLYLALTEKRLWQWAMAGAAIAMILAGGSRGPLICIAVFCALMALISFDKWRKKPFLVLLGILCVVLVTVFYETIILGVSTLFEQGGISSRTLTMLLNGSITSENGRARIWEAAIEMIRTNPLGYGAMGARHVITAYHDVGHPHQFFLEIFIDYGVLLGGAMLIAMFAYAYRVLFRNVSVEWRALFLVFLCRSCHLLISGTYWHIMPFWACIGLGMSYHQYAKRIKRNRRLERMTMHK